MGERCPGTAQAAHHVFQVLVRQVRARLIGGRPSVSRTSVVQHQRLLMTRRWWRWWWWCPVSAVRCAAGDGFELLVAQRSAGGRIGQHDQGIEFGWLLDEAKLEIVRDLNTE